MIRNHLNPLRVKIQVKQDLGLRDDDLIVVKNHEITRTLFEKRKNG